MGGFCQSTGKSGLQKRHAVSAGFDSRFFIPITMSDELPIEELSKEHQINYQVYIDERKALVEGEQASADHFDKHILTLAASALGISVVFLEKIAPKPDPTTFIFLYISWLSLVISMLFTLSSFLTSQHAHRRQRKILEEEFFPKKEHKKKLKNRWGILTMWLNWTSIGAFIIGVGMLAWFSIKNVKGALLDSNSTKIQQTINK